MRVRLKYNHWYPKMIGASAITLYPWILVTTSQENTPEFILKHELVHVRQVRALGWLRFYTSYLWEYVRNLFKLGSHSKAYLLISLEQEAYLNEGDPLTVEEKEMLA